MGRFITMHAPRLSPRDLPGLALWLDARDYSTLSVESLLVSQWRDKSGKNNHAVQGATAAQPKYVAGGINFYPAIEGRHDGANASKLSVSDHATLDYSSLHVFLVFSRTADLNGSLGAEFIAGKANNTTNEREHRIQVDGSLDQLKGGVSSAGTTATVAEPQVPFPSLSLSIGYVADLSFQSGAVSLRLNNGTAAVSASAASVFNGTSPYVFFSHDSTAEPFAGRIAEYLFFTRVLSTYERQQMIAYLAGKWGVTL